MRVVVIGGTGRVATYIVPRLLELGHEVVVVSRGRSRPRRTDRAWDWVEQVHIDRKAAEADGDFGRRIAQLRPEAVIDMICYHPASAAMLVEALAGAVQHLLVCGTLWVYGHSVTVPADETQPRRPICDYGRGKADMEAYLLTQARRTGFPATVLHAGHIVSPSDDPINPVGNKDVRVFGVLARGEELAMPNMGMETLHHVHADDVAQGFIKALGRRCAVGESFHIVSPAAVTMRGYAETVAGWFGRQASLRYLPYEQWKAGVEDKFAQQTYDHLAHSPNASIEKARRLLDYQPRYSSFQAVREALDWLIEHGRVRV